MSKAQLRDYITSETEKYIASGGVIQRLPKATYSKDIKPYTVSKELNNLTVINWRQPCVAQ